MEHPVLVALLRDFGERRDATLRHEGDAYWLELSCVEGHSIEVRVPDGEWTLEWFVTLKDGNGEEVAQDWDDVYAVAGESHDELVADRLERIHDFLRSVTEWPLRLGEREVRRGILGKRLEKILVLERETAGSWEQVLPFPVLPP